MRAIRYDSCHSNECAWWNSLALIGGKCICVCRRLFRKDAGGDVQSGTCVLGIDLGARKRMTRSNGETHRGQRHGWREIRRLLSKVSRCKHGSKNRRKAVARPARFRRREFARQRNSIHPATTGIIHENGMIAVERLQVANMPRTAKGTRQEPGTGVPQKAGLNREILSQNWSLVRSQLRYKAEWAGRKYAEVAPKYTSQACHRCHTRNRGRVRDQQVQGVRA